MKLTTPTRTTPVPSPVCEILDLQLNNTDNIKKLYPEALDKIILKSYILKL